MTGEETASGSKETAPVKSTSSSGSGDRASTLRANSLLIAANLQRRAPIKAQPAAAPPRTTMTTPPVSTSSSCPKGLVPNGRGGCQSTTAIPPKSDPKPPTLTVLSCTAGTHPNKMGTACIPDVVTTSAPDSTTTMTETPASAPPPQPTSVQVTTPGTGTSSGTSSYGGPPEPQYAPPEDFQPDIAATVDPVLVEKMIDGKVVPVPGSTADRTALYVGGALAALGVGYLAFKKFKSSGERT